MKLTRQLAQVKTWENKEAEGWSKWIILWCGGVVATTEPLTNRSTWWIHLALVVACSGLQHWMYSELENVKRKTGFCWTLCIVFHHWTWTLAPRETTGDFIVWAPRFKKGRWRIAEPFQGRTGRLLWGWSVLKVVGTSCNLADSIHQLERMQHSAYLFLYMYYFFFQGGQIQEKTPSKMPCGCPAGLELLAKVLDNVSWKYWKPGEQPAKILDWMPLGPSPTVGDGLWTKIL